MAGQFLDENFVELFSVQIALRRGDSLFFHHTQSLRDALMPRTCPYGSIRLFGWVFDGAKKDYPPASTLADCQFEHKKSQTLLNDLDMVARARFTVWVVTVDHPQ